MEVTLDRDGRIESRSWICPCGATIETWGTTGNDEGCDQCGRLFNCFGQELAPVSQWEESC
jgi:hypothetical protein